MANLAQLSRLNGSRRGLDMLGIILSNSPFINAISKVSGFELSEHSYRWTPIIASAALQNRALGGTFTATDYALPTDVTGTLAMQGGRVDIDASFLADIDNNLDQFDTKITRRLKEEGKKFAKAYEVALFNGAGTTTLFKGLKTILDGTTDLPGYTGVKGVVNAKDASADTSPTYLDLTTGATKFKANSQNFLELFYKTCDVVTASMNKLIICNSTASARLNTIARTEHIQGENRDLFGVPVPTFNGIPIITVDDTVITNAEADDAETQVEGTTDVTTSIYIMSPAEMQFSLLTNSGLEYNQYEKIATKESGVEKWEIRAAWKIEDPKAVRRIRNIKL